MLNVTKLSKSYSRKWALDDLTFSTEAGQIVAVVGPNGAGKTTLFNVLVGILQKNSGSCAIDGTDLADLPLSQLGYLAEEPYYYPRFTAEQTLRFEMAMRQIEPEQAGLADLIDRFSLQGFLDERMNSLSYGMAKRVLLAAAFLGSPRLLLLDEPLNALDIQSVIALKEQLLVEKQRQSHILISSHVLSFLDETADRVLFLNHGKLVAESSNQYGQAEQIYRELFLD